MRATEFVTEAGSRSIRDQILADVRRDGGDLEEYFVRFTAVDKLGFSDKQQYKRSPDLDDPNYDIDYVGIDRGRRALWFYRLKTYLNDSAHSLFASNKPYVWLVRLRPDAWLQPVNSSDREVKPAPQGMNRVGILKLTRPPAAIFFTVGFDVVGKYYNYGFYHRRHGQQKGPPPPSWFDRIRGYK